MYKEATRSQVFVENDNYLEGRKHSNIVYVHIQQNNPK